MHFKIHVPEIIKHEIHTKTVFVHVHKPGSSIPKKAKHKEEAPKKTYHKETHQKDWSSWSNYGYHSDYDDKSGNNLPKDHEGIHKEEVHKQKESPLPEYPKDSYMPMSHHNINPNHLMGKHGDMVGYSYPPQYAVHENVKETDHNDIEPYQHTYEEGYHKGGESAQGHVYMGDVTKFYEGKHEEGDHSIEEEAKNESMEKTHSGRYFIDDNEYQRDSDKYKPEKRASFGMFVLSWSEKNYREIEDRANDKY